MLNLLSKNFLLLVICVGVVVAQAPPRASTRELLDYIQEARKLGLNDEQIKKNALSAGWDNALLERAYAALRVLNNEVQPSEAGNSARTATVPGEYRIGAGDTLQVIVLREPDASVPEVVVRADGKITLPLIKEVEVGGLTTGEAEKAITLKLGKLLREPDVTVVPRRIASSKLYVIGAVRNEGPVALNGPMTVLQALTEAGGLNEYAKRKKIYILRIENGRQIRFPFDYQLVVKGEHTEQNIMVKPEDTIIVP